MHTDITTLSEYQLRAHVFASYHNPIYPFIGAAEEAGEIAGKLAKYIRKHGGMDPFSAMSNGDKADYYEFRDAMLKELGDCLWMISECATALGMDLCDVARGNIAKLDDRQRRGVIVGEGDDR